MHVHKTYFLRLCCLSTLCLIAGSGAMFPLAANEHTSNATETAVSQQVSKQKVTGVISDASGPLVGVAVAVKGSSIGTVTDLDGNFSLDVASGEILEISYLGYVPQSIKVTNQTNLSVVLKENAALLNEVVVVGYGSQKKSDITGAMVNVKSDIIKQAPVANIASALQGLAAGVDVQMAGGDTRPGAVPTIRIRGERSIKAGNDALVVVDGVPFAGSLNDINNDDIQSVSILKDASSTAIYGSRGANGVVLITTKRGSKGKTQVSYNGYYGVVSAISDFKVMNSEQFIKLKQWAQYNANPAKYTGVDDPELMKLGIVFRDQDEMDGYYAGTNTDWQDLIFKNGIKNSQQVSLNGGSEKTSYNASLGYFKGENNYRGHSYERFTAKFSLDSEINSVLKVGLSTLNTFSKTKGEDANPMDQALRASPFATPYKEDGSLRTYLPGSAQNVWNPLLDEQEGAVVDDQKILSTFTTGYLELTLPEGFKYRFNGGAQLRQKNDGQFEGTYTTKRMGALNRAYSQSEFAQEYTLENIVTWNKTIKEAHNILFTGLFSYEDRTQERTGTESFDYYDDNVQYYNPGKAQGAIKGSGDFDKWSILSYMGRLNYNFKERYLLTATVRYDGSSRLAEGNKWHAFPSLALGWNIIQESFMENLNFVSGLKLRASWGNVGSTAINPYQTLAQLSDNKYILGTTGVIGVYPGTVPDKSLGWENTETYNVGLDFGFLSNRINGTLELYQQNTTDLLLPVSLPATSGYSSSYVTNLGGTRNRGVEFNVSTVNINGDGQNKLLWTTDFNIFANRNKIVDLGEGVTQIPSEGLYLGEDRWAKLSLEQDGLWQDTPEDRALAETFGYKVSGPTSVIGNVKVKNHHIDYEADGVTPKAQQQINEDDRIFIGRRSPNFEGGINNRFALKGFDLAFLFTFRQGGILTSDMHNSWMNEMKGNYNNLNIDYWTPDNTSARWPKPSAGDIPNKGLMARYNASYLKLRNITIGYTIPKAFSAKYGVQSARLYATASNLYTWFDSQYKKDGGIDPETTSTISLGTPATRSFVFGLNLSF